MSGAKKRSASKAATCRRSWACTCSRWSELVSGRWNSMPCAAASSSMPTMTRRVVRHRSQAARREGGHADVVFLVGRGRQAVDAGRMRQRLVLRGQRGGGHLGDHEAGIHARLRAPGRAAGRDSVASISSAMRRSASAPISAMRQRQRVGREGHRLGVEVAARDRPSPSSANTSGLSVTAFASISSVRPAWREQVEAGAHHLRLAAQAVRVLHALVADQVRGADRAAGQQRRGSRRRRDLARLAAHRVDARVERRVAAARGVQRQRAARPSPRPAGARPSNRPCSASAVETWVPLISARPSLAASTNGSRPARRERRRPPA